MARWLHSAYIRRKGNAVQVGPVGREKRTFTIELCCNGHAYLAQRMFRQYAEMVTVPPTVAGVEDMLKVLSPDLPRWEPARTERKEES